MTFRLKTIIGIAIIEGVLLLFLVWSSMNYLVSSAQDELAIRAETASRLIADMSRDAILATDLARLDSVVGEVLRSPEVVYIRIKDAQEILTQQGEPWALEKTFSADVDLASADDGVFDVAADITESGQVYGRVELGLSLTRSTDLIATARQKLVGIAAFEMLLVGLFSYVLGAYLTRGLRSLTEAADAITQGALGTRVEVRGSDELALAGKAFNAMSVRLVESQREMERSVEQSRQLAHRVMEQEVRLQSILNTAVDGFITINADGIIDSVNAAGARLFGYLETELIGQNVSCLMPEPQQSEHDQYLRNFLATGIANVVGVGREVVGKRKDGSLFPMDLAVSEMALDDEKMFVGLVRDISERKAIEAQARRSSVLMGAIVAANLDALITMDIDGRIVEWSPAAHQLFGYTREEALGAPLGETIIPPHLRSAHEEGMARYLKEKTGVVLGNRIEVDAMRRGGEIFPAELTVQAIDVDGETLFTAFIRDISERKAAEAELTDAKIKAESASEAKSRFVAHMSHEIRSPLNAVLGSVGLLLEDDLNTEQRLYAKTAQTSGKTLLGLINDILDFSKIEAGELVFDAEELDLAMLLSDVADLIAYKAAEKSLHTAIGMAPGLSSSLIGDPVRLRQILVNLMDNAIKFTDDGAVVLLTEKVSEDDDTVRMRFIVKDTGIGISQEAQERLFNEFQQVDSSDSTRYGGTGLGLSICKGLTEAMGGVIHLQSEPGKGSTFSAEIPFAKGDPLSANVESDTERDERRVLTQRILVVGLHPLVQQALRFNCQTASRCAEIVDSVAAAIEILPYSHAAVLADGTLPVDELALLAAKAREVGVQHLILITPRSTKHAMASVLSGDFDDLMPMPLLVTRMVNTLRGGPMKKIGKSVVLVNAANEVKRESSSSSQKILLAEDSPANQVVANAILSKVGYKVDIVETGAQAVEAFLRGGYALILMDLRMPEMNGLEATQKIRKLESGTHIPIVAMTANASREDVDRCMAAGMDDFVAKPVDKAKLFTALQRHMSAEEQMLETVESHQAPESDHDVLIDESVIDLLAEDTTPEAVPTMLKMFVEEVVTRSANLRRGLDDKSLDGLEDEAHTLKSCAGTFGALRLQIIARDLEAACRDGNLLTAVDLGEKMQSVMRHTVDAYRSRFKYLGEG